MIHYLGVVLSLAAPVATLPNFAAMNSSVAETLQVLRERIREIEVESRPRAAARWSTGVGPLDELLSAGGLRRGSLVELISATDGAGAWTLGLVLARQACGGGRQMLVIDDAKGRGGFYPPAAARLGLDLRRCLVVRPPDWRDAYAAMSESLRCVGVGAVIGWAERLRTADARRLQLAADRGGGVGFLVRPAAAARWPACAPLRLRVTPLRSARAVRRLHVEVLRCRGRSGGQVTTLEVHDGTGHVCVPAGVAAAAAVWPAARATG